MYLTEKYWECFIEYVPIGEAGHYTGIEATDKDDGDEVHREIEKRVDIQRAKRAGCRGAADICRYLNTGRR